MTDGAWQHLSLQTINNDNCRNFYFVVTEMRVAVIGAGISGIVSLKSCLEEELDVICYEGSSHVGMFKLLRWCCPQGF